MQIYIKNMVCNRCIMVVEQELKKLGVENCQVTLGEVKLPEELAASTFAQLQANLAGLGFEVLDNAKKKIIEKIKNIIIQKNTAAW